MESFSLKMKNFHFCDVLDVLIGGSRADLKFFHSHRWMVKVSFFFSSFFFWLNLIHRFILALIIISEGAFSCCILNSSVLFVSYQSNTASAVLETITNIQPKESGGGVGETREAIVYRLSEDMLSKLPPDYVPHEVSSPFPRHTGLSLGSTRLSTVLGQYISVASSPCSILFHFVVFSCLLLLKPLAKLQSVLFYFIFLLNCLFCTLCPSLGSSVFGFFNPLG